MLLSKHSVCPGVCRYKHEEYEERKSVSGI